MNPKNIKYQNKLSIEKKVDKGNTTVITKSLILREIVEEYLSRTRKYLTKESFDFVNRLSKRKLNKDDFMNSFDS